MENCQTTTLTTKARSDSTTTRSDVFTAKDVVVHKNGHNEDHRYLLTLFSSKTKEEEGTTTTEDSFDSSPPSLAAIFSNSSSTTTTDGDTTSRTEEEEDDDDDDEDVTTAVEVVRPANEKKDASRAAKESALYPYDEEQHDFIMKSNGTSSVTTSSLPPRTRPSPAAPAPTAPRPTLGRRDSLRLQMTKRKRTLTKAQVSFLQKLLAAKVSDKHLKQAEDKLKDDNLFYDSDGSGSKSSPVGGTKPRPKLLRSSGSVMGSLRRIECLESRKNSSIHTDMWIAASRRNLMIDVVCGDSTDYNKSNRRRSYSSNELNEQVIGSRPMSSFGDDSFVQPNVEVVDTETKSHNVEEYVAETLHIETKHVEKDVEEDDDSEDCSIFPFFDKPLRTRLTSTHNAEGIEIADEFPEKDYDPWSNTDEDFNGIKFDFKVIGTSPEDEACQPHVLSPPLMHSLQQHLPFYKRGESFWLKYSLVRDGAATTTFLKQLRGSKYTVMAVETVDGEVFGAFTASPWHIAHNSFGGGEAFLWKMKKSRNAICTSVAEQAKMESDIEVFKYAYENPNVQQCQSKRISVGGGTTSKPRQISAGDGGSPSSFIMPHEWGFAIAFEGSYMLEGTSSPCLTFTSPSLSKIHSDGSRFELVNLEVWALTPCVTLKDAEAMECTQLFFEKNVIR